MTIHCINFVCSEYRGERGLHGIGCTGANRDGEIFICRLTNCIHSLQYLIDCMMVPGSDPPMAWYSPICYFRPKARCCPGGCCYVH